MAKLPPKAFYKLRIAKQMRNAKYNLIAVEECIQNYLSIHFSDTHSTETSNSFNQLTNTINGIMDSLGIQFSYGAPINDSYTPIIMHRTAKSYFKMAIADKMRDSKNHLIDAKEYIIEYLTDNELNGKDEIKHMLSVVLNLIDKIMNTIDIDINYGAPCAFDMSFDDEEDDNEDDEDDDEDDGFDYDNENEDLETLRAYCKEVFSTNNCNEKNYSMLIDNSFENGMADSIPITLKDLAKIRSNIGIWYKVYDEAEDGDELDCELFLINMKIDKESHLEEYMNGNKDIYLPISSLLKLWYIIKDSQYYYENN